MRKDSSSSKNKGEKSNGTPPPPPPNNAKPQLPQIPTTSSSSLNISFGGSNAAAAPNAGSSNRNYGAQNGLKAGGAPPAPQVAATPERRFQQPDRSSPAPPIVVVSPDTHGEPGQRGAGNYGGQAPLPGEAGTPPRTGPLNRLRQTPKDTIPIIGKPPRKQRSSRFIASEKVEIDALPAFSGKNSLLPSRIVLGFDNSIQKHLLKRGQTFSSKSSHNAK